MGVLVDSVSPGDGKQSSIINRVIYQKESVKIRTFNY